MTPEIAQLKEIHECFSPQQAGTWAVAAERTIRAALPFLASCPASSEDGFPEALLALRDVLDRFNPNDPEVVAFELCDRLMDVFDLIEDHDQG